jgi:hypothetical protein
MGKPTTETADLGCLETALADYLAVIGIMGCIGPDFSLAKITEHAFIPGKGLMTEFTDLAETLNLS